MDVRSPLFQNIALILAGVMFLNPIVATAAQLTVDAQAGGNTRMEQAANGVPIVNIATPSGSGLSHNKFTDYNVGQQGLILNNATERLQSTQQGGLIIGNSNLQGRAAGVILNEVTGSNRSQLKGYTEVAGQAAHVIVANPHGITCDGCGFINTPRATLSTGVPVIERGRLERFDVEGGDIAIEGAGLNADNIDQFDLITRSARINADVHANQLNIVAGRNQVDATTLAARAKSDNGAEKPLLAIDSSALGGMYAGAIRLVGTEAGVGVKLAGDMAASAGDIQIDAEGRLSVARMATSENLSVAGNRVELGGPVHAAGHIAIDSAGTLSNQKNLAAAGAITLRAGTLENSGIVEAGVEANNSRNTRGDISLEAGSLRNTGHVVASRDLQVHATHTLDNQGGAMSGQALTRVQANALDNRQGRILARDEVQVHTGSLDNADDGLVSAGRAVALHVKQLANRQGEVSSQGTLRIVGDELDNRRGRLIGEQALDIDAARELRNAEGVIASDVRLALSAGSLDNSGRGKLISQDVLTVKVDGELDNSAEGSLVGLGRLVVHAAQVDNRGAGLLSSDTALNLNAETLDNRGGRLFAEGGTVEIEAGEVDNRGGDISSTGSLGIVSTALDNSEAGRVIGDQGLRLTVQHLLNHTKGVLSSRDGIALRGDSLDNSAGGIVSSQGALELELAGRLDNRNTGLISTQDELRLQVRETDNRAGQIVAGQALHLSGDSLDNTGGVISSASMSLAIQGSLLNAGRAQLASAGPLRIEAGHIDNRGGALASQGLLTLLATTLDNADAGTLLARQALAVRLVGGLDNRRDGLVYSQAGELLVDARHVANDGGALQSEGDLSVVVAEDLSNQQGRLVSANGNLSLRAGRLDNQGGTLDSKAGHLQLDITGVADNRDGTVQGRSLGVASADLDNANGHFSALAGDSHVQVQALNNRHGGFYAQGALELRANSMVNANGQVAAGDVNFSLGGALHNQGGLIESESQMLLRAASLDNQGGSLRSLGGVGATRFDIGALDNRDGLIEIANADLLLQVGTLDNLDGRIRHLGSGTFGLTTAQVMAAGGSLVTGSALDISAATWVNSSLLQAARLVLNVGHFTQTATGQLVASHAFSGSGDTWINHGVLASDGDLSMTLSGGYSGDGRMSSLGDLNLNAADIALSQNARISAGGVAGITSDQSSNQGTLTSVGGLSLITTRLDNHGTLGSRAGVRITAPHLSNDGGLLFSGENMALQVGDFVNYRADVYSQGDLEILGQLPGSRANLVDNNSGTLESGGDLRIQADTLRNRRDRFATEQQRVSGNINVYWDDFCDGKGCEWYFTSVERFEDVALDGATSAAASIGAGGDLNFHGSLFDNRYSTVSVGGDIEIGTDVFNNIGAGGGEERHLRSGVYTRDRGIYHTFIHQKNLFNQYNNPASANYAPTLLSRDQVIRSAPGGYFEQSSYVVPVSGSAAASAIVQAAGSINITADEQLNNSVLRPASAYVGDTSRSIDTSVTASTTPLLAITSQLPPDLAHKQINPLSLPGFSLPTGQNGLFRLNQQAVAGTVDATTGHPLPTPGQEVRQMSAADSIQPSAAVPLAVSGLQGVELPVIPGKRHKYLIETNPALTELGRFLNSDYMLGKLGYDPDHGQKRLGDGLYEQRLIREAVIARTGQRFMAGRNSDEAMFRYLMDNAIASKHALGLSLGVSLSAAQVAALTHDIVWMEEVEVAGEKVLAPVLYLAQPNGRLMANGALVQGRDVTLVSGHELNNSGTLRASNSLAGSASTIDNRGLLEAGDRLALLAQGSIRNAAGGIIAGRDVSLSARAGDIINERSVTTISGAGRGYQYRADVATAASRIEAANDLALGAGRDIRSQGSVIQVGGDGRLGAGRDVQITSQREEDSYSYQRRRETGSQYQVAQYISELQTGGNLAISAGRNLDIVASRVRADGDVSLQATDDLLMAAAANENHEESYRKHAGKKTQRIETGVSQQQAEVNAGGRLVATAGADMAVVASDLSSGGEAFLYAGKQLALLSAQNSDYYLYDMKKKGSWGRKKTQRDEVTTVRSIGSTISSGGDLTLVSEGDQLYQRARLESGSDLTLDSGGDITFEAVKDLDQESHEKSKNSWAWTSAKGKGTTDETLLQSQLLAQGNLVIKAVDGLNIDIKQVDQQTIGQTIDAMVKADPGLAWLKEMEQRGDVDWTRVKEVHDSFKYSHSGLGVGAQLAIAIVVAYFTAGAVSEMIAGAANAGFGTGAAMAAATPAQVVAAGGNYVAAGWANVVLSAVATSAASGAAISAINNRGNLGAVLKDVTSGDALKGYATSGLTAGLTSGVLDSAFGVTGDNINRITKGFDLSKTSGLAKFGSYLGAQGAIQAVAQTAVQGGSLGDNLQNALTNQVQHLLQAGAFNAVGDFAGGKWVDGIRLDDGSPGKIALHAVVGGLLSEATGGDFKTGALAGGANELLIEQLSGAINGDKNLQLAVSQLIGVAAASATGGDMAKAAELAKNATAYNRQLHEEEKLLARKLAEESEGKFTVEEMEDALRRSSKPGEGVFANTDMVVTADGIYDEGGKWILGGDGKSFVQVLPEANVDAIRYVADNTSGYAWDDRSLGIRPDPQQMQPVLEFPGCISCAAGFSYSLNTVDMRTPSQIAADQRAFTLGVASLAGLLISGAGLLANYGVRPLLIGAGLGSGFDGVGQVIGGGEYRPGQTLVAGVTGALAYPLAGGGALANALLGASVGATNATANNYFYSESKNIGEAAVIGAFAGSLGTVAGKNMSDIAASILPYRIGSSIIDPNKAILLQNIGVKNPYPNYVGGFSESLVGEGFPILFDKLKGDE